MFKLIKAIVHGYSFCYFCGRKIKNVAYCSMEGNFCSPEHAQRFVRCAREHNKTRRQRCDLKPIA